MNHNIGLPLECKELQIALKKVPFRIAPRLNSILPIVLRALGIENLKNLFHIYYKYFNNELHIKEWQQGNPENVTKKSDLSYTNNWRGINLLDVTSKVISIVISSRS